MKTNSSYLGWILISLFFIFLLLLMMFVTNNPAEVLWLKTPGWSRAKLVGTTGFNEAVPMTLDEQGQIYFLFFSEEGDNISPQVVALNRNMEPMWEHTFEMPFAKAENTQIMWAEQAIYIFWLNEQQLYTASLGPTGEVRQEPTRLSGETKVEAYDTTLDAQGEVWVWYSASRQEPGLYALLLTDPKAETIMLDAAGINPILLNDNAGMLHAVWTAYNPQDNAPLIYHAAYAPQENHPQANTLINRAILITKIELGQQHDLENIFIGTDDQKLYLVWNEKIKTGRRAGQQEVKYISFPLNEPAAVSEAASIYIPFTRHLVYDTFPEYDLEAGPRASLPGSGYKLAPWGITVNSKAAPELALAISANIQHLQGNDATQIVTIFGQNGILTGYQLLSFNPSASFTPALISDQTQHLYLNWLERKGRTGYNVYFASTSPDIQEVLSSLSLDDLARLTTETLFGMLQGIVYAPFLALLWLILPLTILGLTWFMRRNQESLTNQAARVSIIVALIAYWASKLFTFAATAYSFLYVPFSAWIPNIPTWLSPILQLSIPLLIIFIGLRLSWHYTLRTDINSVVIFIIIYAGIDSLLTMAIYGGLLFDGF